MRHARRQHEDLALADRDVDELAVLHGLQQHLAFDLVEQLGTVVHVIIAARVRAADDLHDEAAAGKHFLVADRRFQVLAVVVDPVEQLERQRGCHRTLVTSSGP